MKKAFTMLELVFVIVVVGILSAMIAPNFQRNSLREAADQVISHIRYTQHLAMMDDKYSNTDNQWYLGRWQIVFSTSGSTISYRIQSEHKGAYNGNPDADSAYSNSEVASNPENRSTFLIGVENSNFNNHATEKLTKTLDIGDTYGITKIKVTGGNSGSARRILFDSFGRPYKGSTNTSASAFIDSPQDGLFTKPLYIKFCKGNCTTGSSKIAYNDDELVIKIEKETGYACVLKQNSSSACVQ